MADSSAFEAHVADKHLDPHPQYSLETDTATSISSAIATHAAAADPHTGYRLESARIALGDIALWPHVSVVRSSALIASDSTITVAQFTTGFGGSERFDNVGMHNLSTNTSRLTVTSGYAGLWTFGYQCGFASNASGRREAWMEVNSNGAAGGTRYAWRKQAAYSAELVFGGAVDLVMAVGDYMELFVYQTSGGNLNFMSENGDCFYASYRGPTS